MRYYNFALYASAEQIRENTTINLREYAYENTYAALNNYMYKRLDNYIYFMHIVRREIQLLQFMRMMKRKLCLLIHLFMLQMYSKETFR